MPHAESLSLARPIDDATASSREDWRERFAELKPIRKRGAFHLYTARCVRTDQARLLVLPADDTRRDQARERLRALHDAHARVRHPALVQSELAGFGDQPFVSFAVAAQCDGEAIISALADAQQRVPYAQAMAVVEHLGSGLIAAHGARDASGQPLALGGMAWGNVIISTDGTPYLLGLGHNVVGRDEHGRLSGAASFFVPPELAGGAVATCEADAFGFVMLQRSVIAHCDVPAPVGRVFAGQALAQDRVVAEAIDWSTGRVLAAPAGRRGTMRDLRGHWLRELAALGVKPDLPGLKRSLSLLLRALDQRAPQPTPLGGADRLIVLGPDARWFRHAEGACQWLDGHSACQRILRSLCEARLTSAGRRLTPDELLQSGWPGERVDRSAGLNRVYVAIARLRKLGLREVLRRDHEGYHIDTAVTVRLSV